jgi:valyl-tRNA synthetase
MLFESRFISNFPAIKQTVVSIASHLEIATHMFDDLPKQYNPSEAQSRWYKFWLDQNFFHSEPNPAKRPYTIVIPPPNVTGALHLGHALNNTLQDILIRQKRMQGFEALWMPGTDHAGIATQAMVERRLNTEEKINRHQLGRQGLLDRIWAWKDQYERRILGQLQAMGCSCDWDRTRFTLDAMCAKAVRHTFFKMFRDHLIYRGKRLVNWDTHLQTAVSDDEVFHETVAGSFWYINYPVIEPKSNEPAHVTVATTRPETMLGDTAVAVHPDPAAALDKAEKELQERIAAAGAKETPDLEKQLDALRERRQSMLPALETLARMARDGRKIMLPLVNREIPLVADVWAKPELGTGCVKITPAHDPNDYEVGLRQSLPMTNILNVDGTLNEDAGAYKGLTIRKAREAVVADLEKLGLLAKTEDREIELAHSDRSKTPIEPLLKDQWFVKMDRLAQTAMDAVTDGRVKIHPDRYAKSYLDWLSEKRDWPIGRQLWWGHQIPIWYCKTATEAELKAAFAGRTDVVWQRDDALDQWLICAQEEELSENAIAGHTLTREADVLDTWFSSALWPHSTLGWPEQTAELAYYYPTSVLITSRDIITLWVARMVLTGLYNVGDVPFHDVYIHPKILDGYGEGMSKSKGNGVDPVDVIEKFGADALRFGLAYLTTDTQDIRIPVEFECPHCQKAIEQTKQNRIAPRVKCKHCGGEFSTQWADKPEDTALPRGAVLSERFELARNFCNKLWNAARMVLMNLEGYAPRSIADDELRVEDRWILSRLASVTQATTAALAEYRYADAMRELYGFAWDEFCAFYLEITKTRLSDPAARPLTQQMLVTVLDNLLRLLHPVIPFVTEEIWQLLAQAAPKRGLHNLETAASSIVIAPWPAADEARRNATIEAQFTHFQNVLRAIRDIRSRQNVPPKKQIEFSVRCDTATADLLRPMEAYYESMAGAKPLGCGPDVTSPEMAANVTVPGMEVFVDLAGLIDVAAEIERKEQEEVKIIGFIAAKQKKLENKSFVDRAPAAVVDAERASLKDLEEQLAAVRAVLDRLRAVDEPKAP